MIKNLLHSLLSLVIALFFLTLGIIGILLPWSPTIRTDIVLLILEDSQALFLFGFAFFVIGIAIVIHIAMSTRHRYYHLKAGSHTVKIDETVIQDYLDSYWKQLFPQAQVPNRLMLKKNKIHLIADLPYIPAHEQKDILERINHDLTDMFTTFLGYRQPFYLSASFQQEKR